MKGIRQIIREEIRKVLIEGDDLLVKDFPYQGIEELDSLGKISHYIVRNISNNLLKNLELSDKEQDNIRGFMDHFSPDGDGYFNDTGVINFYADKWPERTYEKIIGFIKWILSEKNITVGETKAETYADGGWTQKDLDERGMNDVNLEDVRVIRIPIIKNEHQDDEMPPDIHLSSSSFDLLLRDVLGYEDFSAIDAVDLIMKINSALKGLDARSDIPDKGGFKSKPGSPNIFLSVKDKEYVKDMLSHFRDFAQWTIDNGYSTVYVA